MSWQQDGFLVLSDAGIPLYHGFFTTRWEAESKLKEVQALPEAELKYGATIVPARLWFDWRGTPKASPTLEPRASTETSAGTWTCARCSAVNAQYTDCNTCGAPRAAASETTTP